MAYLLKVGQLPEIITIPSCSPDDLSKFLCEQISAGLLEFVTILGVGGSRFVLICDEMGKLTDKPVNIHATVACAPYLGDDVVVGDCIICDPVEIEEVSLSEMEDNE